MSFVTSALCHDTASIRGELQPRPPPPTPHCPSAEQLQDPHHQGITVTFSLTSSVSVLLKLLNQQEVHYSFAYFIFWRTFSMI